MANEIDLGIKGLSDCKEIGSGGFASVYSATEDRFGRTVAVKVLSNLDVAGRRRFEREQLTMGRMTDHPNVVTPHSSGYTSNGFPYLVMEYLEGGSLAAW
ncbi:MAG: protein kinase [Actinomycetia bacterium]|nr:protein kinase [Actinomycetes bacterium]